MKKTIPTVSIHEAKTQLSRLVDRASKGEPFIIFQLDPRMLRRGLLDNRYSELLIGSDHAVAVDGLPVLHKDPFDRILIGQATVEGMTLLTADPLVAPYAGPVRRV